MRKMDDAGTSEVIGYILSFALSSVFLLIALTAYHQAQTNTDSVVTAVELKAVADRVATRVVDAGLFAQEFPNASINISMDLPQTVNGHSYKVTAANATISVVSVDAAVTATSSTFKLDAVQGVWVYGSVYSSQERVIIGYSLQDAGTTKQIVIHGA